MNFFLDSHKITNQKDIEIYIKQFYSHKKIWLWQDSLSENEKPTIHFASLIKDNIKKNHLEFKSIDQHTLLLKPEQNVNILSPYNFAYFQSSIKSFDSHHVILSIPKGCFILSQEVIDDWDLLPIENELANKHLRQAPRVQSKLSKTIGIQRATDPMERVIEFPLYDMSQSGAGFLIDHPSEFEINQKLIIKTLDGKSITQKIRGEVKGIREMEDQKSYKVGLMFDIQKKSIIDN
jgi:hypothetical protein